MYGLNAQAMEALHETFRLVIENMHVTRYAPSRDEPSLLELVLLERSGVEAEESAPCTGPMMAHTMELEAIRATSLSPAKASDRIGSGALPRSPGGRWSASEPPMRSTSKADGKSPEATKGAHSVSLCTPILAPT